MKRTLVTLTAALLALCLACGAFAEAQYDTETYVEYTGSGWCLSTNVNYNDAFYEYFSEKFNMDFIAQYTDFATNDERLNLLVNTSSMPDGLLWMEFNYDSYLEWIDQGLLKALPDGWQEKYPNLHHDLLMTGILDKITVDGKVYVIPHAVWCNFVSMDTPVVHDFIYYRKDWVNELGIEPFGDTVKLSELLDFCQQAIDNNLGDNDRTVGLTAGGGQFIDIFMIPEGYRYTGFEKTNDGYVWGPTMPGYTDKIAEMRDIYKSGVIDPDFYLGNSMETFSSGAAAAYYYQGAPYSARGLFQNFYNAHGDLVAEYERLVADDPKLFYYEGSLDDYIGMAVLTDENDVPYINACFNYWSATIFNPDIDEVVFDRILSLTDWLASKEGEVAVRMGVPGVDWVWADEAQTSIIRYPNADGVYKAYDSSMMLCNYALCGDEMSLIDIEVPTSVREFVPRMYEIKNKGFILPTDPDFSFFTSESKARYSVDIYAKIISLIVDDSLDIEAEWEDFIAENARMVDPLIADLNAEFFGK